MNKKPRGGVRFQKGKSGNPLGAAAHNKEHKALRRLATNEITELGTLLLDGNVTAIVEAVKDPESSALKVWMGKIIAKGIEKGDPQSLSIILDRVVGKVKERVELSGDEQNPLVIHGKLTEEDADMKIKALLEKLKLSQKE